MHLYAFYALSLSFTDRLERRDKHTKTDQALKVQTGLEVQCQIAWVENAWPKNDEWTISTNKYRRRNVADS